jgi:transposase InsO family protein
MIIHQGKKYLEFWHIEALRDEPGVVRLKYEMMAMLCLPEPFRFGVGQVAMMFNVATRTLYRWLHRFKREGFPGLRSRSRRPHHSPNQTPTELARRIVQVREATGFGPVAIAQLLNESNRREGLERHVWPSTVYNVLVREGLIEKERQLRRVWRRFEWKEPNQLIQVDLTEFNGVQVLTCEDDHSRKAWATALPDAQAGTVASAMSVLLPGRFENLLTDNGNQFSRACGEMREFCFGHLSGKHIWCSPHHPQTLGKLSAYQKGLKAFLIHRVPGSQDVEEIDRQILIYNEHYNNFRPHSSIGAVPEARYSGKVLEHAYDRLVKSLKLEEFLCL